MARFLDPKADITFKKVFGEHKNLVISLLNAMLPLDEGKQVESIEYLPPELVPRTPTGRNSIVDVRCEADAAVADRDAAIGNLLKTAGLLKAKGSSDKDIAAITGLDFDTIGNLPGNS